MSYLLCHTLLYHISYTYVLSNLIVAMPYFAISYLLCVVILSYTCYAILCHIILAIDYPMLYLLCHTCYVILAMCHPMSYRPCHTYLPCRTYYVRHTGFTDGGVGGGGPTSGRDTAYVRCHQGGTQYHIWRVRRHRLHSGPAPGRWWLDKAYGHC